MVDDSVLISQFNEAKFQILRINYLWMESKKLRESGDLEGLMRKLDSARVELENDIKRLKYTKKVILLDKKILLANYKKEMGKLYRLLMDKEKLLREIQSMAGKGDKMGDPDDEMM